jgi:GMP synthase PP-ATPase subunit
LADILFLARGLGIRILGDVTPEKVAILQEADAIFGNGLKTGDCTIRYGRLL